MPEESPARRGRSAASRPGPGWIMGPTRKGGGVVALVIVSTFVVLVLGVLVAGLLRSHADILRSLHELGVGVGDPVAAPPGAAPVSVATPAGLATPETSPALGAAPAVAGVTPAGDARAVAVDNSDHFTLLGFLSSGCA